MSEIRVNNITNRTGTSGPDIGGIPVIDSTSHFVVPTGRTGQRYADGGENIVRDGLVLYLDAKYSYPGASGTNPDVYTWYDMSGNGNDGELLNSPIYSSTSGGIIDFSSGNTNKQISFGPNSYSKLKNYSQGTIECWINIPTGRGFDRDVIFALASQSSVDKWIRFAVRTGIVDTSKYSLAIGGQFAGNSTGTTAIELQGSIELSLGNWVHCVASSDGNEYKLFVNGVEDTLSPIGSTVRNYGIWLNFGQVLGSDSENVEASLGVLPRSSGDTDLFEGIISNFKLYNRPLTASEVLQNYNATKDRFL